MEGNNSLVAYAASSSSSEDEEEQRPIKKIKKALPTAAELFDSIETSDGGIKPKAKVEIKKKTTKHFAPPQLKRPNVSTEDVSAWNLDKTRKKN